MPITDSTQTLPITEPVISLSKSGAPKKKVKWESDDKLVTIKEYIKDEGEVTRQINNTKILSFSFFFKKILLRKWERILRLLEKMNS